MRVPTVTAVAVGLLGEIVRPVCGCLGKRGGRWVDEEAIFTSPRKLWTRRHRVNGTVMRTSVTMRWREGERDRAGERGDQSERGRLKRETKSG